MKISSVNTSSPSTRNEKEYNQPNFKSIGMSFLNASGAIMQGIENQGYFASFLIQDSLGMTFPRVVTGFMRDKEETGEYNIKEGFEVLGREGMTGPFMISVAPLMLFLMGKFCKSTGSNTRLIKYIGKNMKSLIESPELTNDIKNNKDKFKNEFYKFNIDKIYKESIPNDKNADETINYIVVELNKLSDKNKKVRKQATQNILDKINNKRLETSSNLDNVCKLNIEIEGKQQPYKAEDVIKAIVNYADDAIVNNPESATITPKAAENIKDNLAAKRLMLNLSGIAGTLGGLSVLPKIYARNKVAPGAQNLVKHKEEQKKQNEAQQKEVAFRAKGINNDGLFAKIGKFLTKNVPAWVQGEFEYLGYNFTAGMMACLSLFGLLLPRGLRAYNRAYIDENGKRDMSEIHEILLRDSISSLAVVYTVPILTKCVVNSYENKEGFILTNKASRGKSAWKRFIDVINPYSDLHVYTNDELRNLYDNIDSKAKIVNFAKYIDNKDGDLQKIFSKSSTANTIFNENTFTLSSIKNKPLKEKNAQIISLFENMKDGKDTNDAIIKLMKDKKGGTKSSITSIARGFNSVPGLFVTAIVSPIILGCLIPLLTYANTRKTHAKMMQTNNNDKKSSVA